MSETLDAALDESREREAEERPAVVFVELLPCSGMEGAAEERS